MDSLLAKPRGAADNLPAELFGYEVLGLIGEGAASRIYAVSDGSSGQIYALKHVVRKSDKDQRFIEQLENEYEIGRQVRHPKLRRALEVKYNRTLLLRVSEAGLLMEMFHGLPLDQVQLVDHVQAVDCFIQTADALNGLHGLGFVHCDLKPNNILLNNDNQVKVIDLGQTCKTGTAKERIQGTPDYIAPEQVKREPVTPRTDVFNLGATMYWTLCGRKLPTLFTLSQTQNSFLIEGQLATPSTINPTIPENLSNLIMECVRSNPSRRPRDMAELIHRLQVIRHSLKRHQTKKHQ